MRVASLSFAISVFAVVALTYVADRSAYATCDPAECELQNFPALIGTAGVAAFSITASDNAVWHWCLPSGSTPTHGSVFKSGSGFNISSSPPMTVTPSFFNPIYDTGSIGVTVSGEKVDENDGAEFQVGAYVWPPLCEDVVDVEVR